MIHTSACLISNETEYLRIFARFIRKFSSGSSILLFEDPLSSMFFSSVIIAYANLAVIKIFLRPFLT